VKTNVLLASEPVERLSEEVALNLAEWYGQLMEEAATGGRPLMAARAKAYYAKFFETHRDHDDALGMRAALGMKKIGGHLPRADEDAENQKPRNGELAGLKPGETITDMTFAEFIAAHPKLTAIGPREIGTAGELTSLRPLEQLPELRSLDFDNASKVEDLSPLAKLTKLESLTLKRLPLADIELIGKLGNLKRLNLNGADDITDLSPLKSLPRLEFLSLQDCDGIEDLKPIENLTSLTFLNLANCDEISDIKPLANLSRELTWLNLNGTKIDDVMPLARMGKLKRLDLRDCRKLDSDDIKWLKKRLSNCEILENAVPAAQPAEKKDW
jgi:hypothetical protein